MLDPLCGLHIAVVGQRTVRCPAQPGYSASASKPFTAYQISVYRGTAFSHAVEKRYSDYERLHRQLCSASVKQFRLPDLPSKPQRFLGLPDGDSLRRDLEAYTNSLLAGLQRSGQLSATAPAVFVCRFLGVEPRRLSHSNSGAIADQELDWSVSSAWSVYQKAAQPHRFQQQQQQHSAVVRMPEVDLIPRAELDLLTYTVIDTVYQSSGSSSIDD